MPSAADEILRLEHAGTLMRPAETDGTSLADRGDRIASRGKEMWDPAMSGADGGVPDSLQRRGSPVQRDVWLAVSGRG